MRFGRINTLEQLVRKRSFASESDQVEASSTVPLNANA
jgi:hypothetical protein